MAVTDDLIYWLGLMVRVCLAPRKMLAGMRLCRKEGCGFWESVGLVEMCWTVDDPNHVLSERLETSIWLSEHPGCTFADLQAWRMERLHARIAKCRVLVDTVRNSLDAG